MRTPSFHSVAIAFQAVACLWVLNGHLPGLTVSPFPMPPWQQGAMIVVLGVGLLPLAVAVARRGRGSIAAEHAARPHGYAKGTGIASAEPPGHLYGILADALGVALWVFLILVHPREVPPPAAFRLWVAAALFVPLFCLPLRLSGFRAEATAPRPAKRCLFAWWMVLGAYVACELTVGEAIRLREWRIMIVESDAYAVITDDARRFRIAAEARWRHLYSSDPDGYFGPERSVVYQANQRGLRERELPISKPPGVTRVIALGDSFTLGEGVHVGDTWPRALERTLNERHPGQAVEVINAGVSAYDCRQELAHYRLNVRDYQPDAVVVALVWNDAEVGDPGGFNATVAVSTAALAQYLPLTDRLMRTVAIALGRTGVSADPTDWRASFDALRKLRDEATRDGATFLVAVYPSVRHLDNRTLREVYALQERFCRESGISVFNAWPVFADHPSADASSRRWYVHPADNHPNAAAHRRFATALADSLDPLLRARFQSPDARTASDGPD